MSPANQRGCYIATPSLIGLAHSQNVASWLFSTFAIIYCHLPIHHAVSVSVTSNHLFKKMFIYGKAWSRLPASYLRREVYHPTRKLQCISMCVCSRYPVLPQNGLSNTSEEVDLYWKRILRDKQLSIYWRDAKQNIVVNTYMCHRVISYNAFPLIKNNSWVNLRRLQPVYLYTLE